ncbi:Rne/Rng family ribonuclease [Limibaculum sp. FT325]|uniref:Rne/Rng family ribonuclease n=1 Tax=Thermohalobaculum sediminis TaxID=2939436 RepID=UPI0020BECFF4|nr:Rne/Rng family ribonuclease [Limibaculum sediminis]MCL5778731.1 Rne/Rng family ribonuclease [Limibaculum sediminis]
MAKKMLIDATHPEETRVVVVDGNKVDDFDFESINKRQLAGNIYLAKVTRVEPSLQAAFVDYGGNRHGFLAFAEIHPDYYQIPVADRQALLREEARAQREAAEDEESEGGRGRNRRGRNRRDGGKDAARSGAKADRRGAPRAAPDTEGSEIAGFAVIEPEGDGHEDEAPSGPVDMLSPAGGAAAAEDIGTAPATGAAPAGGDDDREDDDGTPRSMAEDAGLDSEDESVSEDIAMPEGEAGAAEGEGSRPKSRRRRRRPKGGRDDAPAAQAGNGETPGPTAENGEDGDGAQAEEAAAPEEVGSGGTDDLREEEAEARAHRRRRYRIQDVIKVRQIMLVQVVKEERGNKGAALTTYLSLAGRYCVLMPNTARGGGISRKIVSAADRKRLREIVAELDVPEGMGLIVRTAGAERTRAEIKRDYEFLLRQWEQVRDLTLKSSAPCLIYEEGSLIKRTIRDIYSKDIDTILVAGDGGYREAKDYMKMLMPSHAKNVQQYADNVPLFIRYQVESYLNGMFSPVVQLKSGGYIVIGVTEALVAIDVNSGRSTREGSIEETATKTNLEAADEVARQLRLRDLAGLIVIDFIDMEDSRNIRAVEKRMKERLKTDRARIQVGRISAFGLMEMSRQRLRPGMLEATTQPCPHCHGQGIIRSDENMALAILREIEEEGVRGRSVEVGVTLPVEIANYLINFKRRHLAAIEERYGMVINVFGDATLLTPNYKIERAKTQSRPVVTTGAAAITAQSVARDFDFDTEDEDAEEVEEVVEAAPAPAAARPAHAPSPSGDEADGKGGKRRRRGKRGGRRRRAGGDEGEPQAAESGVTAPEAGAEPEEAAAATEAEAPAAKVAAATEPAEAAPPDAAAPEAAEAEPKKRRPRRKKADAVPEAAEAQPEAPAAEEAAPKPAPRRRKSAKARAEEAAAAEAEAAAAPAEPRPEPEPVAPQLQPEAVEARPDAVAEAEPEALPEAHAKPEPAQPEPMQAEELQPAPVQAEQPQTETVQGEQPQPERPGDADRPKRRGWWSLR